MSLKNWSTTASSNATVDSINFAEGQAPSSLNDSARALMVDVKAALYNKGSDIASATTTDLAAASTEGLFHDITGTTTITGLGTVAAGVWKVIKFEDVLTLTHNGTSLILPGASNITTGNGDIGIFVSEGSGNWRCVHYEPNISRACIYVWDARNPADVAGSNTNFGSTGTFTGDTNLVGASNSSGTVTFTLKRAGKYLCIQSWEGSNSTTYTDFNIKHDFGGSATRYNGDDSIRDAGDSGSDELFAGSWTFMVSATANQTVTSLPQIQVTGGGTAANFTGYSQMTILYVGA